MSAEVAFFQRHGARRIATTDRVLGCPHQEGIDYVGEHCPDPVCSFWVGVDRFTGKHVLCAPYSLGFADDERVRAEPFEALEIALADLWA